MNAKWKYVERVAWIVAIFAGIFSFRKDLDVAEVINFGKQLWSNLTPWQFLFFLSIALLLYQFITFLINVHRATKQVKNLNEKVGKMEEWIGILSHKDAYSDLKGKIRFFAKEEIEKFNAKK